VRLVVLPNIMHQYLDTPLNTSLATLHAISQKYDILLYCNSANSFCTILPRALGTPVVINVDGLEWKRAKWNWFGKVVYKMSEFMSTFLPNQIVTDAREVQSYYQKKFSKKSNCIPYGALINTTETTEILDQFGVQKNKYILYVSRLEPENNAHVVIKAFEKVNTKLKLVIVGDSPFSKDYVTSLKKTKDSRVIFTGYVFGQGYREFQAHAYCYIQATEAGGTQPALVEAMGAKNCILANDVPQHREVLGDAGEYFSAKAPKTLTKKLQVLVESPSRVKHFREKALQRVQENYSWNKVTTDYETLFRKML